jgi:Amt family ammonium transporter
MIKRLAIVLALSVPLVSFASDLETLQNNINTVWTCLAAFMVFFMQAGFALVEMGMTRAKNCINIIMKNLMDFAVGSLLVLLSLALG